MPCVRLWCSDDEGSISDNNVVIRSNDNVL